MNKDEKFLNKILASQISKHINNTLIRSHTMIKSDLIPGMQRCFNICKSISD